MNVRLGGAIILLSGTVLLAGCSTSTTSSRSGWYKASATQTDFQRDRYECFREASMVPQVPRPESPPPTPPDKGGYAAGYQHGQATSGYQARIGQSEAAEERALMLFGMCMQSRGWAWR